MVLHTEYWVLGTAQRETLCNEGRQKPLKVLRFEKNMCHLNRQPYAVKHPKFHLSMSSGLVSTPGNKKLSYFANASSSPQEVLSSNPTRSNE